ncbi:MAG: hypothetical protein ACK5N0_04635 [Synechococcaceae cyanobacterium]
MVGPAASRPPAGGTPSGVCGWTRLRRRGLALVFALAVVLVATAPASALPWPWGSPPASRDDAPLAAAGLQEVAPPLGVQQLRPLLESHQPRLRILAPEADSLVPAGPWTLRLELSDWPLVDAGPEGLGPHLVVQLDDAPPLRLTATSWTMPPLEPGSHRLSVFAAMPWGEAMRNPGAFAQIRLHRAAANPMAGPAPGTPQLIPVLPAASPPDQPLLLDWILVDAPLQHLRGGDDSWRLRLSLDGESLLLDRQEALWLQGLSPGRHPLVLELVDLRGAPLNPPFNSLVRELVSSAASPSVPWLSGPLLAPDLAQLSGVAPASPQARSDAPGADRPPEPGQPTAEAETPATPLSPGRATKKERGADRTEAGPPTPTPQEAEAEAEAGAGTGTGTGTGTGAGAGAERSSAGQDGQGDVAIAPETSRSPLDAPTAQAPLAPPPPAAPTAPESTASADGSTTREEGPEPTPDRQGAAALGGDGAAADGARADAVQAPGTERQPSIAAPSTASPETPPEPSPEPTPGPGPAAPSAQERNRGDGGRSHNGRPPNSAAGAATAGNAAVVSGGGTSANSTTTRGHDADEPRPPAGDRGRLATDLSALTRRSAPAPGADPRPRDAQPSSTVPPEGDRGASPLEPAPAGEVGASGAELPRGSRSVKGNGPSLSLRPRPSPPEPFDPWSSPLSTAPTPTEGRPLQRDPKRGGVLDRLRQLIRP